jgi:hypothetical protein
MTQLEIIFLTSGLTVVGGLFLLVLGEVIKRFFIAPIHELALLRGKTTYALIVYADVIANPGIGEPARMQETHEVLRRRAAQLLSRSDAIPWYSLWHRLGFIPKQGDVQTASALLIGLSNSVFRRDDDFGVGNDARRKQALALIGNKKLLKNAAMRDVSEIPTEQRGLT